LNKNEEIIDQYFVIDNPYGKKYYSLILRYVKEAESGKLGSMMKISNRTGHTEGMIKEERNRISGDIHDNLSNMVNVISMNLDYSMKNIDDKKNVLKCIGTAYEASNQIRLHLRRILNELTPVDMKEVGVINAVKSLFRRVEGIGVKIDFSYTDLSDAINYHEDYGMLIYKTCMEGINNALFNGRATKISVLLSCDDEVIKLHISDNGVGCEEIIKGRGLTSMEHRIQSIEGNVVFESVEGEGFWIKAEVPIRLISFVPIPESIE
jgi:signal transduction histidine kinase